MKTLIAAATIGLALATVSAVQARDLAKEFREGFNPESNRSLSEIQQDFRQGYNPQSNRTVQEILSDTNLGGQAKPDSFRTGVDLGGI